MRKCAGVISACGRKPPRANSASWEASDEGALALVLVLDQFPRNMFRGDARTYASDVLAREVAHRAISRGVDTRIDPDLREFLYLPLMHSEHLPDQMRCIELLRTADNAKSLNGPSTTRKSSGGSGASRIAIASSAASPRLTSRLSSIKTAFPADDGSVNGLHRCRFRPAEYCARHQPGLRNNRSLREN